MPRSPRRDVHQRGFRSRVGCSYASIAASVALFLAVAGGTGYAAQRYLINSTRQIAPAVLKKLHGVRGPAGADGARGANGAVGAPGVAGSPGANGTPGVTGAVGATGATGVTGGFGATGATGATGAGAASVFSGRVVSVPTTTSPGQTTGYGAPTGLSTENATETSVQTLTANTSFTASNLTVLKSGAAVPAGDQIIVDMDVNGSPMLICGIQAAQTICNSNTQTVSVAAGSLLSIKIIAQAGSATIPGFDLLFGFQAG